MGAFSVPCGLQPANFALKQCHCLVQFFNGQFVQKLTDFENRFFPWRFIISDHSILPHCLFIIAGRKEFSIIRSGPAGRIDCRRSKGDISGMTSIPANLPKKMTAVEISTPGGPEVLKPVTLDVPEPGDSQVLIKTAYAGVNRPDCLQRAGAYPPPKGASPLPGLEVSGEIVAAGKDVDQGVLGSEVMALTPGGGYAEYVLVDVSNTLPVPVGLSMAEAAAVPETFFTVWHNVFQRGGLQQGETLLVHGGTSGIGTTAIQLAKAFGASVIATAGSDDKCQACIDLGAHHAINYREKDFVEEVRLITEGGGTDLILDMVGGSYIERNYDASAEDGRIVSIAFLGGAKAEVNFAKLMVKRLTHTGSTLRPRPVAFKARIAKELQDKVWPLIKSGQVKPVMHSEFALADAAQAHALMESSSHIGKIVLQVNDGG